MPVITRLGVARQTTLMAQRCLSAVDEALALPAGPDRDERMQDAKLFSGEIGCWIEFAGRKEWHVVVRHGMTQYRLSKAALELLETFAPS